MGRDRKVRLRRGLTRKKSTKRRRKRATRKAKGGRERMPLWIPGVLRCFVHRCFIGNH